MSIKGLFITLIVIYVYILYRNPAWRAIIYSKSANLYTKIKEKASSLKEKASSLKEKASSLKEKASSLKEKLGKTSPQQVEKQIANQVKTTISTGKILVSDVILMAKNTEKTLPTPQQIAQNSHKVTDILIQTQNTKNFANSIIRVGTLTFTSIIERIKDVVRKIRSKIGSKPISAHPIAAKLVKEVNAELRKMNDENGDKTYQIEQNLASQISTNNYGLYHDNNEYEDGEQPLNDILFELELRLNDLCQSQLLRSSSHQALPNFIDLRKLDKCIDLMTKQIMYDHNDFVNSRPIGDTTPTFYENLVDLEQSQQISFAGKSVREKSHNIEDVINIHSNIPLEAFSHHHEQPFTNYYNTVPADRNYYEYF